MAKRLKFRIPSPHTNNSPARSPHGGSSPSTCSWAKRVLHRRHRRADSHDRPRRSRTVVQPDLLYGRDTEPGQVINFCRQMPMMGSYEVVILKGAAAAADREALALHAEAAGVDDPRVCHKEKSVDKRSAFYKQAAACGAVFESVRPRDYEIGPWLAVGIHPRKGCRIDEKALSMLTDHLGCDVSKIANELGKLLVSLPEGRSASPTATSSGTSASRANTTISSCARPYSPRHGARAAHRRPLRPQPQGQSAAGDRSGAVRAVPATVRTQLPLLARAAAGTALSAGRGADAHR